MKDTTKILLEQATRRHIATHGIPYTENHPEFPAVPATSPFTQKMLVSVWKLMACTLEEVSSETNFNVRLSRDAFSNLLDTPSILSWCTFSFDETPKYDFVNEEWVAGEEFEDVYVTMKSWLKSETWVFRVQCHSKLKSVCY